MGETKKLVRTNQNYGQRTYGGHYKTVHMQ